jgi:hypothetical protein
MVGSTGAALDRRTELIASSGQPTGARVGAAASTATDCDLAWQTTVGQIVFLESVVYEPT